MNLYRLELKRVCKTRMTAILLAIALVLAVVVSAAVLCPAAFAAQLPSLPKDQCVVDDAGVLSSSTVQTIQDSTEDQVVFAQSEVPIVTGDILNALRTTGKTLCVVGDGYTLNVSGKEVKSTTSEIDTAITFTESEEGLEFELDNGRTLPCAVQLELDVSTYSRLYLYNTISNKWQFLNSYKDGVITADTAGRYLLTNQNLRFGDINWTFFIAAGALTVVCLIVYIAVKKRYWFW